MEIQPLSDQDDILKEARAQPAPVAPVEPITSNMTTAPTPSVANQTIAAFEPRRDPQLPVDLSITMNNASATINSDISDTPFHYRLPVFSYVLVWVLSLFVAFTAIGLLATEIQYNISFGTKSSNFTSSLYSDYAGSANTQTLISGGVTLAVGCLLIYMIISGRKVMRFGAILLSLIIFGYQSYIIISAIIHNPSILSSGLYWSFISLFSSAIISFMVPIAIVIYMLLPKARAAYR